MNRDNLIKRLVFAAWAIPAGWLIINANLSLVPPAVARRIFSDPATQVYPAHVAAVLLVFLGASEYLRMLGLSYPRNGFWIVYVWLALQMASHFMPESTLGASADIFILFVLVAIEAFVWGRKTERRWRRASMLFSGTAFFSIAGLYMLAFYDAPFQDVFASRFTSPLTAQMGIITVVAAIFFCDTAAYFAGSLWGTHRFSSISPKKTIEGSVAGLVAATVVTTLGWQFLSTPAARDKYGIALGILLGIVIGVFAQIGDLVVSLMKRYFRVKDASDLIPGHGGVLDRFDSVFFASPAVHLFVSIVTRIVP
ncbi:MAG: hypothetical protein GF418_02775 [Chitinivibrionales bacterium]|nr:hypothetical protein [Chitinivibrionales bacterium]MBD3394526.1 hypothetical protein [Chitinivibrionales bacterium]